MTIGREYVKSAFSSFSEGATPVECDELHIRSNQRGGLFRLKLEDGNTVVAKVWNIRNLKERFKSITRISNGWREYRMHRLVYQAGIATPEPISFFRSTMHNGSAVEVMIMEDIGVTTKSLVMLKSLLCQGNESKVLSLENEMIEITAKFLNLNILDIDHQPNNFVVDTNNRLLRVDFECARMRPFYSLRKKEFVTMIARFITGHIHAVQPDVDRSVEFAMRLYNNIAISKHYKELIKDKVNENLAYQLIHKGVDTKVTLPV